jgi:hypothetical protein
MGATAIANSSSTWDYHKKATHSWHNLLYLRMEKLIGSVLWTRVDKRRSGSDTFHVRTVTGHWLYPVHLPLLPGFWGETKEDQHREC